MALPPGRKRVTITLDEAEYRELLALAEGANLSVSWIGRQAVREFLKQWREGALQLPLPLPRREKGG